MKDFDGNWNYPTRVWFGIGRIESLPAACDDLNMANPLFITDPGLAQLPIVERALAINALAGLPTALFTDIKPNPVAANIAAGVQAVLSGEHDGIIAMGGGSALDSAKTIALIARQSGELWDYEDVGDNYRRINVEKIIPLIAIPTTAGTGSEVGRAALIIDEDRQQKRFIFHPDIVPNIVIADPELTVGLPPFLTATTGMDALAHNLEAYCAPGFHPMADGIALEGLRLIKENLPTAYQDGSNLTARANLMAASIMGGTAFQKGLGAVHSLSHPVGAVYDHHHGLLNAVFMPYVLRFNHDAIADKMKTLANYLKLDTHSTDGVIDWLLSMYQQMKIPTTLAELNIDHSQLDTIVKQALADPSTAGNPKSMTLDDFAILYSNAIEGNL